MPLKAVAFDVDGTLYPNASMYLRSIGWALSNARLLKALERARGKLRDSPQAGEDFHRVQARMIAQDLGLPFEETLETIERQVYTHWFRIFSKLRPYPGLLGVVAALRQAGLKTAVMSDFPIRGRVEDLGLPGPWDCAFSSEETGYLKPNPQTFQALADRLNLLPSEVLYVGNSYTYDVLGAFAAGMPCAHLTKSPRSGSRAALSFSRYSQLEEFVFRCVDDPGYDAVTGRISC